MSNSFNLERLRKEAKALLKRIRAGDTAAFERIRVQLPKQPDLDTPQIKLADIHHALARERGFENWTELNRRDSPLEQFLAAVRSGAFHSAQEELNSFPDLAAISIHAACSIGDVDAVRHHLELDSKLIDAKHSGWSPLIYACASRFHKKNPRHAAGIVDCVALLLDRGADPNSFTLADPSEPDIKIPAVARAQASFNPPVELLLRQRGAEVGDGPVSKAMSNALRSLYPEPQLFVALSEINRQDPRFNAEIRMRLAPVRDRFFSLPAQKDVSKDPPALPLYLTEPDLKKIAIGLAEFALQHSVNPNLPIENEGNTMLHGFARLKDYPDVAVEAVAWLLAHGADPNIPRDDGQTPFVLAVRLGNTSVADVMRAHGADLHSVGPLDELMGACRNRDAKKVGEIQRQHPGVFTTMGPEAYELLVSAAATNRTADVRFMAEIVFDVGGIGVNGATALHVASWNGHVEMVHLLLELRAPVNIRDAIFGTSPLAWAARASKNSSREEDYCGIIEALLDAGTSYSTCVNRWGVGPEEICGARVVSLLQARGFLP
jgi:ankyrin repeat protein